MAVIGRFAPSPTGSLHLGSLLAAVGSWLSARAAGGSWLARIEDLDPPRVVPGSADEILNTLERFGLRWDGPVLYQSQRNEFYREALAKLEAGGFLYECGCSRAEVQRAASAPEGSEAAYAGMCRDGLPPGRTARAIRFRVGDGDVEFCDRVAGLQRQRPQSQCGDFVVRRADGLYSYQLAVVVDDGAQGITEVVRGCDLLASTARQIVLQRALGLPQPGYAHLPLVVTPDGSKLGKRYGSMALSMLSERMMADSLLEVFSILGISGVALDRPEAMLSEALTRFRIEAVSAEATIVAGDDSGA